jgi:hypothetical protein
MLAHMPESTPLLNTLLRKFRLDPTAVSRMAGGDRTSRRAAVKKGRNWS